MLVSNIYKVIYEYNDDDVVSFTWTTTYSYLSSDSILINVGRENVYAYNETYAVRNYDKRDSHTRNWYWYWKYRICVLISYTVHNLCTYKIVNTCTSRYLYFAVSSNFNFLQAILQMTRIFFSTQRSMQLRRVACTNLCMDYKIFYIYRTILSSTYSYDWFETFSQLYLTYTAYVLVLKIRFYSQNNAIEAFVTSQILD